MNILISGKKQKPLRLVIVYRPQRKKDGRATAPLFFQEFSILLERLMTEPNCLVIAGDFNFHLDDHNDPNASMFLDMIVSANLKQLVHFPTHVKGHTLDLILTRASDDIISQISCTSYLPSDHAAITCKLTISKPEPVKTKIQFRKLKVIDIDAFRRDILQSKLHTGTCLSDDVDELIEQYESVLKSLLDKHAPVINRTITSRPRSLWFNEECHEVKQNLRRLERRWRSSRLEIDHQIFVPQAAKYHKTLLQARKNYYSLELDVCGPREFFLKVDRLCRTTSSKTLPRDDNSSPSLANRLCTFFGNKTDKIVTSLRETSHQDLTDIVFRSTDHRFVNFCAVTQVKFREYCLVPSQPLVD